MAAGQRWIKVDDSRRFTTGRYLRINQGNLNEEDVLITGFGSRVLTDSQRRLLALAKARVAANGAKDCSMYKTDKAKAYCASQNQKAAASASAAAKPMTGLEMNNGIFGDSGVSYSKGVEDLFATAFGATRQNKNVREADVGGFASDIGSAAKAAIFGN